jgi:hypothetical protein
MYRFGIAIATALILAAVATLSVAQDRSQLDNAVLAQAQPDKGKGHADKGGGDVKAKKHNQHNHHNGKDLLGDKIKTNGHHVIDKKGDYTAAVDVQNGKVAGMKVTHATKGDVPVRKYKTSQKMAQADGIQQAAFVKVQGTYIGTTYIGYAYVDEYGNEEIFWYPYDMIVMRKYSIRPMQAQANTRDAGLPRPTSRG